MSERASKVQLNGDNQTAVLCDFHDPFNDGYDFVDFTVIMTAAGLSAESGVRSIEGATASSLHGFLGELAADWKGTIAERHWESIDRDLAIATARDDFGHVDLTFTLRESYRSAAWTASVTIRIDGGEDLSTLIRELQRLLSPDIK